MWSVKGKECGDRHFEEGSNKVGVANKEGRVEIGVRMVSDTNGAK